MRFGLALGALVTALLAAAPSRAQVSYNGYLSQRMQLTLPMQGAPMSTRDVAVFQFLTEANIQPRFRALDDKLTLAGDMSAFFSVAGGYTETDTGNHALKFISEHDVPAYHPSVVFAEGYAQYDFFDHLSVVVGKKRVVWGTGQAFNPSDLINPPRDPTDPNFQRAGAYILKVDVPFEKFTLTALAAPKVLYTSAGLPYSFFMYPGYAPQETVRNPTVFPDPRDSQMHYALAARLYALLWNSDINVWMLYTNRFNDDLENKPRLAASFSRYFFTDYEFHFEGLAQMGTARTHVTPECVASDASVPGCLANGTALTSQKYRNLTVPFVRLLVGSRYMLKDESIITVEYLHQSDGYTPDQFQDAIRLQQRLGNLQRGGADPTANAGSAGGGGLPTRFSFDPLRRHYLLINYLKTQILDDFTVNATWIAAVEDLSSTLNGFITWNAKEWLNVALYGFLPLPSPGHLSKLNAKDPLGYLAQHLGDKWGAMVPLGAESDGQRFGEYDAILFRARVILEARVFF